ncbi:MAG TPA: sialidase family protein [Candidatus Binatia bacterium]|nr:sialidase family protein [Candidatus Binatia bacterium]
MAIGLSHGGTNVYSASEPSRQVWVGTQDGLVAFESTADGEWRESKRALRGQHISSIIFEPISGTMFAGAFFGSVHASTDGGSTWERRDNGIAFHDVYSLASHVVDGKTRVYAGTQPAHLFISEDLGRHWTELSTMREVPSVSKWSFPAPPHVAHTKFIAFDPHDAKTIFACVEQGAFLKSTDEGKTWAELNTVGLLADKNRPVEHFYEVHRCLIDPRDPKKIYVTGGAGLYVTHTGGGSWERWTSTDWAADVYPDGFTWNPKNPDLMFVAAAEHNPQSWRKAGPGARAEGKIYRSDNGGKSWQRLGGGLPESLKHEFGALCLEESNGVCSIFGGTTGGELFYSGDNGETWKLITDELAPISKKGHERLLAAS